MHRRRRAYFVPGLSPMSVTRPGIQLEGAETGDQLEVAIDELTGSGLPPIRPKDGTGYS
jgi:hypothetical protein